MKASFYTLGCKVNQAETARISELFQEYGYSIVSFGSSTDIIVINTCSVTHVAERKSRNLIRRSLKNSPAAKVIVCGCYANLSKAALQKDIPEIHEVIPQDLKFELTRWNIPLAKPKPIVLKTGNSRVRQFLKIQDGCDNYCSYCIVPYARPELFSLPLEQIVQEAKILIATGATELIVTGINVGKYKDKDHDLADVLEAISQIPGLLRLRLSSIEPDLITLKLLKVLKSSPVIARHLHIPLQSGSDPILKLMSRHYNVSEYTKLIQQIRHELGPIGLTSDVIVGFPGETRETFQETLDTVKQIGFSDMHIFKYSPRPGTKAAKYQQLLKETEIENMFEELNNTVSSSRKIFCENYLNQAVNILIDEKHPKYSEGLTSEYIRALVYQKDVRLGSLLTVTPEHFKKDVLIVGS